MHFPGTTNFVAGSSSCRCLRGEYLYLGFSCFRWWASSFLRLHALGGTAVGGYSDECILV